jgi:hypothetical protein
LIAESTDEKVEEEVLNAGTLLVIIGLEKHAEPFGVDVAGFYVIEGKEKTHNQPIQGLEMGLEFRKFLAQLQQSELLNVGAQLLGFRIFARFEVRDNPVSPSFLEKDLILRVHFADDLPDAFQSELYFGFL